MYRRPLLPRRQLCALALALAALVPASAAAKERSTATLEISGTSLAYTLVYPAHLIPSAGPQWEGRIAPSDIIMRERALSRWLDESIRMSNNGRRCESTSISTTGPDRFGNLSSDMRFACRKEIRNLRIDFHPFDRTALEFTHRLTVDQAGTKTVFELDENRPAVTYVSPEAQAEEKARRLALRDAAEKETPPATELEPFPDRSAPPTTAPEAAPASPPGDPLPANAPVSEKNDEPTQADIGAAVQPEDEEPSTPWFGPGLERYLAAGIERVWNRADGIAFVLALLLPTTNLAVLITVFGSFVVAHSLTLLLAGGLAGVLSPAVVDIAIAVSVSLAAWRGLRSTRPLARWRLAAGLGVFHGLAYAQALDRVRDASADRLGHLLAYNFGLELGLLTMVVGGAAAFGLVSQWARGREALRGFGWLIVAAGVFWTTSRLTAWLT